MNIILAFSIIIGSTSIGYFISSKYKLIYNFYNEILLIFNNIRQNLNFKQDKLIDIFEQEIHLIRNKDLFNLINNYINYLKNKNFEYKFTPNLTLLTQNENNILKQIFNSLGHSNLIGENANLDFINKVLAEPYNKAKEDYLKFNKLYIKLGFFAGCFIVIILI